MRKHLSAAVAALAFLVVVAVLPVSADEPPCRGPGCLGETAWLDHGTIDFKAWVPLPPDSEERRWRTGYWWRPLIAWDSPNGVLFWVFDKTNPEALAKVLDGREVNGHYWLDVAVTSDLLTETAVCRYDDVYDGEMIASNCWLIFTGPGGSVPKSSPGDYLATCAMPWVNQYKVLSAYQWCPHITFGTSISIRDAFDENGRIPDKYLLRPRTPQ